MGLFDWLFGKKKQDQYGGNWATGQTSHPAQPPAASQQPAAQFGAQTARSRGKRWHGLSWRRRRSKEPVSAVPEQTVRGRPGDLLHLGGTADQPAAGGDAGKIAAGGLPALPHFDALAQMLLPAASSTGARLRMLQYAVRDFANHRAHYFVREIPKKSGGTRLLCVPCAELKGAQRKLLENIVSRLPVHESAHGFRRGRSVLSGASVHVGRDVLISMDIKDFFPSFDFRRVSGYFRWLGYSRGISVALANLTTVRFLDTKTRKVEGQSGAHSLVETFRKHGTHPDTLRRGFPELPQGAPTSPGIANAICWRMDKRLSALAQKFGGDYTRYADDLTFSGFSDMARGAERLVQLVRKIVESEGLLLNEKKTRIMRKGRQQRVTGVVVNDQTNVSRRDFDRLKAILHNCVKHGPHGQNRENVPDFEQHLRGRIAHVSHIGPERGRKLMRLFEQIRW